MARVHGKDVRVYLGSRDISGDVMSLDLAATCDVHDSTTFAAAGWKKVDPGLYGWTGKAEGFYDPTTFGPQIETALGSDTAGRGVLSVYDGGADGIGDSGFLGSESVVKTRSQPVKVADLIKLSIDMDGNGRAGLVGKLLHVLAAETVTFNGSSLDNSASSSAGGRGTVHVTSVTGTWTLKVQHSTDNSSWSDLITFTAFTAAGAQTVEVSGTVNRYLRIIGTEDVAGTITFVGGFARY